VIYIVSDFRGSYHYVVDKLVADTGATLIELDPGRTSDRLISKARILRQLLTPRQLRLGNRWTEADVVLVIGWYLLTLLLLMKLRLIPRPRRLVAMGTFIHDARVRRLVNIVLRELKMRELEFIVFSDAELRELVVSVRMPPDRVHKVLYRDKLEPVMDAPQGPGNYVFTGGYSNRDYKTFFAAVGGLDVNVVAVASSLSDLRDAPENVDLRLDVSWDEFESLLAGCDLLVLPLRQGGEASGQNVFFRGIRYEKPVVATRHDSLIEYLGADYAGFVPADDPTAMRDAIERALRDDAYRSGLLERIKSTAQRFRDGEHVEAEIVRIVNA
jgi:glycosyltransferase involved in cell wall biosynthesis